MLRPSFALILLAGCTSGHEFGDPAGWRSQVGLTGPGAPTATFTDDQLWQHCAYLSGDPELTHDHHNLVVMHDGLLWMPWSPEDGGGGVSAYDVTDPCNPVKLAEAWTPHMRESHTMAFGQAGGREYIAVDYMTEGTEAPGGVGFWDITDPMNPEWAGHVDTPGFDYPDAYFFVTLSTFWQGDYVYASGGFTGLHIIDASDPANATVVNTFTWEAPAPDLGSFHVIGNVGMASSAGLATTFMMDVSNPVEPQLIPGGDFLSKNRDGDIAPYYFANTGGRYGLFARKSGAGGPIVYDISDPSMPTFVSDLPVDDASGGYIFQQGDYLFQGESDFGAVYDFSDPANITEVHRVELKGDLDTVTPIGNVAFAAVDSGANPGEATAVIPWQTTPDVDPPGLGLHFPAHGDTFQALTSRIGLSFDEMVEARSVWVDSVQVTTHKGELVVGRFNVQENLVNFTPDAPLLPDTTYVVRVPAGGVTDISGNAIAQETVFRFGTGAEVKE